MLLGFLRRRPYTTKNDTFFLFCLTSLLYSAFLSLTTEFAETSRKMLHGVKTRFLFFPDIKDQGLCSVTSKQGHCLSTWWMLLIK